jgi:hypothetical protein
MLSLERQIPVSCLKNKAYQDWIEHVQGPLL